MLRSLNKVLPAVKGVMVVLPRSSSKSGVSGTSSEVSVGAGLDSAPEHSENRSSSTRFCGVVNDGFRNGGAGGAAARSMKARRVGGIVRWFEGALLCCEFIANGFLPALPNFEGVGGLKKAASKLADQVDEMMSPYAHAAV